jgi:hypothetical protein
MLLAVSTIPKLLGGGERLSRYARASKIAAEELHLEDARRGASLAGARQEVESETRAREDFIERRLVPRLYAAGLDDLLQQILPEVDAALLRMSKGGRDLSECPRSQWSPVCRPAQDADQNIFGRECIEILRQAGWSAEIKASEGEETSILATRDGRRLILECVAGNVPLGVAIIQKTAERRAQFGADRVAIVSIASFSRAALQMAAANDFRIVLPVDLSQLHVNFA